MTDTYTQSTSLIALQAVDEALRATIDLIDRSADLDEVRTELADVLANIGATIDRTYTDPTRHAEHGLVDWRHPRNR